MSRRGLGFHSFFLPKVARLPNTIFDLKMSDQTHQVMFVELEEVETAVETYKLSFKLQTHKLLVVNAMKEKKRKISTCCHAEN
jgi:hypothetical protein